MSDSEGPRGPEDRKDDRRSFDADLVVIVCTKGRHSAEFRYLRDALCEWFLGKSKKMGPKLVLQEARRLAPSLRHPPPLSYYEEFPTLCYLAAARSIDRFMERQVLQGGWSPSGGASLLTFWKTSALYGFVTEYRRYCSEEIPQDVPWNGDLGGDDDPGETALVTRNSDPEKTTVDRDQIRHVFEGKDPRIARIILLHDQGYTQKEIARRMGMSEAAVNSILRRFRRGLD